MTQLGSGARANPVFGDTMTVAFVAAHPGHELRLATWIARTKPLLYIVAKGARSGKSEARIHASRTLAHSLGATPTDMFGMAFDADIYDWILNVDIGAFSALADRLRDDFVARSVDGVVVDGWQNYNPVHDLTHLRARGAAGEASVLTGRDIQVLDYPVVMGRLAHAEQGPEHSRIGLSAHALEAKMALVDCYPEIADDVRALSEAVGHKAFDSETLHYPLPIAALMRTADNPPWYERHGEERVRAGVYVRALRWSHMEPIVAMFAERLARTQGLLADAALSVAAPSRA
jgi:hypothetical protein